MKMKHLFIILAIAIALAVAATAYALMQSPPASAGGQDLSVATPSLSAAWYSGSPCDLTLLQPGGAARTETITVTNNGTVDYSNVTMTDSLGNNANDLGGLLDVQVNDGSWYTVDGIAATPVSLGALAHGQSMYVTVGITLDSSATSTVAGEDVYPFTFTFTFTFNATQ